MSSSQRSEIHVGLMSGTSLDGVDIAIVDFSEFPPKLLHCATRPYTATLRQRLTDLCHTQTTSLHDLYSLDAELGDVYADVVNTALADAQLKAPAITAIGCHGQTIRHSPDSAIPYTVQIGDANRIAIQTGITTVADFRRKDIALGGQAAPLAPAFHRFLFRSANEDRAVINIGGIANVTYLPADPETAVIGFDTGPGNTLLDYWIQRHKDSGFDAGGDWARGGKVDVGLLERMQASEPYFQLDPPKSTGTEYFNPDWLLGFLDSDSDPVGVQATLVELTANTIADAVRKLPGFPNSSFVCGGGAHNQYLLERLQHALGESRLDTTAALGLDPDFVEACAFAWLARERVNLRNGNLPEVTQARRASILGAIYAADNLDTRP